MNQKVELTANGKKQIMLTRLLKTSKKKIQCFVVDFKGIEQGCSLVICEQQGLSEGGRGSRRFRTGSAKNGQGNNEICSNEAFNAPECAQSLILQTTWVASAQ